MSTEAAGWRRAGARAERSDLLAPHPHPRGGRDGKGLLLSDKARCLAALNEGML
jgi:hypothetical protein